MANVNNTRAQFILRLCGWRRQGLACGGFTITNELQARPAEVVIGDEAATNKFAVVYLLKKFLDGGQL